VTRHLGYGRGRYELDLCKVDSARFGSDMWTWLNTAWDSAPAAPLTDCDRCGASAASLVTLYYEDELYLTYLCDTHADLLQVNVLSWVRDGRLVDADLTERSVRLTSPAPAAPKPASPPQPTTLVPAPEQAWWPTQTAIAAMDRLNVTWVRVCEELSASVTIVPSRRPGVDNYLTDSLSVLITPDRHVIGLAARDEDRAQYVAAAVGPAKKIERRGKRGGIGNVEPRTHSEVLAAIDQAPGWTRELAGKHYKVRGPEGQLVTISVTPSDYRSALNEWTRLKRNGLTYSRSA